MASPTLCCIRFSRIPLFAVVIGWFALAAWGQTGQSNASTPRQPVLVELFTSEGCSDCPPADALLAQIDTQQPIHGAKAIVLSEHVTYWNHLGWRDPFSFDAIDERQESYMRHFALDSVYTPQIVVDGAAQFVGSDAAALTRAVAESAATPKPEIEIENVHRTAGGSITFTVRAAPGAKGALIAALAENATRSQVARGENAGRTLHHVAVVRVLKEFGSGVADGRPLELSGANLFNAEKHGEPLRLVVFLADRWSGHVISVTEQTLAK